MKWIAKTAHVNKPFEDGDVFHREVAEILNDFQRCGLQVEIKYATAGDNFTALIIGTHKVARSTIPCDHYGPSAKELRKITCTAQKGDQK